MRKLNLYIIFAMFLVINNYECYGMVNFQAPLHLQAPDAILHLIEDHSGSHYLPKFLPATDLSYVNTDGDNFTMIAIKSKNEIAFYHLMQYNYFHYAINHQNNRGETALMLASYLGQKNMVLSLLQDPSVFINLQCKKGWSALHYAANEKHSEIIQCLIEKKANLALPDRVSGCTPVFLRGIIGNTTFPNYIAEIIRISQNEKGCNQLHLLAEANIDKMAEIKQCLPEKLFMNLLTHLVRYKVDIWGKDTLGRLPIDVAYIKHGALLLTSIEQTTPDTKAAHDSQKRLFHLFLLYYASKIEDLRKQPGNHDFMGKSLYAHHLNIHSTDAYKSLFTKDEQKEMKNQLVPIWWST